MIYKDSFLLTWSDNKGNNKCGWFDTEEELNYYIETCKIPKNNIYAMIQVLNYKDLKNRK